VLDGALEDVGDVFLQHVAALDELERRGGERADVLVAVPIALFD
jgi:hypothetical protein